MYGLTSKPRRAGAGCFGCRQERGDVTLAISARLNRAGSIWLCTACAASGDQRQAFMDAYAARTAPAAPSRGRDAPS